jgi:hypothetical protein
MTSNWIFVLHVEFCKIGPPRPVLTAAASSLCDSGSTSASADIASLLEVLRLTLERKARLSQTNECVSARHRIKHRKGVLYCASGRMRAPHRHRESAAGRESHHMYEFCARGRHFRHVIFLFHILHQLWIEPETRCKRQTVIYSDEDESAADFRCAEITHMLNI